MTYIPNPVQGRMLKEPQGRVRWIFTEDAARLLRESAAVPHLADFIRLALNTGYRAGEILGLEWARVDLANNLIYLGAMDQKNIKVDSVPFNSEARMVLLNRKQFQAEHCPQSPWVFAKADGSRFTRVTKSFTTACRKAGIQAFRIHDLRHTAASWMVQAGIPLMHVGKVLRHASVQTTMRYAHLAPENTREAVAVLESIGTKSRFGHGG